MMEAVERWVVSGAISLNPRLREISAEYRPRATKHRRHPGVWPNYHPRISTVEPPGYLMWWNRKWE